jgi:hypothetical protein
MVQRLARKCSHSLAEVERQVPDSESAEIRLPPRAYFQTFVDT